uniref:Large ribosomal subunit protein uL18c n=1 Tax=Olisthodiscus luteus TaxID=83000 RepID=A0A7U0KSX0_OLILU|nr:ribosomal protein L18 [Olisthodiscus luteus]QQW50581.1 ribosomal protein L18 [Olisthodiscus luteus]
MNKNKLRLYVFRSHKHIYAQIIDDKNSNTLFSCSTLDPEIREKYQNKTRTKSAAYYVGLKLARLCLKKNIKTVYFDKGKYPYHGRIKALAEGARNLGFGLQY